MTVQDLIEQLSFMNPNSVVRFASQPSWPFEYSISEVIEIQNQEEEGEEEEAHTTVYFVEGTQEGYLPRHVKDEIGW